MNMVFQPETADALAAGDGISAGAGRWTFGGTVAEHFDDHVGKSVPLYREGHELALSLSEFFIKDDSVCYELGCSTGALIAKLARKHADLQRARFVGLDIEAPMVALARERHAEVCNLTFQATDVVGHQYERSDFIVSYYTAQFIHPKSRQLLFDKIYDSLHWGGALLLFEKTRANDARFQDIFTILYSQFKLGNGYNAEEILQKTLSLKGVLEPFSSQANNEYLTRAGFKDAICVQKYLSFEGTLAIK